MSIFKRFISESVQERRDQQLESLTSAPRNYTAQRRLPESRYATRALGDRADLGITDNLTLGASAPTSVRTLDQLLNGQISNILRLAGRWK